MLGKEAGGNAGFLESFRSPTNRNRLRSTPEALVDQSTGETFPVRSGIPVFLSDRSAIVVSDEVRHLLERTPVVGWCDALKETYADQPALLEYVLNPIRAGFLDLLPLVDDSRILEIGPGFGQFTRLIAPRVRSVSCLEVDEGQARFVDISCRQEKLENISVACGGDDCYLPYHEAAFDLVILNLVIEWAGSRGTLPQQLYQRRLLNEITRVLRRGGTLYLATKNRFALRFLLGKKDEHCHGLRFGSALPRALLERLIQRRRLGRPPGRLYSFRELENEFVRCGFGQLRAFWAAPEMRFPDRYIPLDVSSIRDARRDAALRQGEFRSTRALTARSCLAGPPPLPRTSVSCGQALSAMSRHGTQTDATMVDTDTGVVVIGRNEGERLLVCLASLSAFSGNTVYVDSDSRDGSPGIARPRCREAVELSGKLPLSAARARNAGFERLRELLPELLFVQFVDGDCELREGWIEQGREYLQAHADVAVVFGRLRERNPERSIYNRLCDMEWKGPVGDVEACGGIMLARAVAFAEQGGFRVDLIAGEEPELCVRLRKAGWRIVRLDIEMASHDAAMTRFAQWWRRSVRTGYAFREGASLHGRAPYRHWVRESRSAVIWGAAIPAAVLAAAIVVGAPALLLLLTYPTQIARLVMSGPSNRADNLLRAVFLVLGKFPEAIGQLIFVKDRALGRRTHLIEYK